MVNPELGTKRTCSSCGARFYDLAKSPVVCPKCAHTFLPEVLLPSKDTHRAPVAAAPVPKPVPEEKTPEGVEIVSLDEVEAEEDEIAALADVDLGDDDDDDASKDDAENDDTFLAVDDDADTDVTEIIGGGISGAKDES